jgi:predicted nucleic acid-binding protein
VSGFLLDTNVPSELTYPKPAPQVEHWLEEVEDEQLFFSVISLAEICKGIAKLPESKKRIPVARLVGPNVASVVRRPYPVTEPIAEPKWDAGPEKARSKGELSRSLMA